LREEVSKEDPSIELDPMRHLLDLVAPLAQFHTGFLKKVDNRLSCWEGRSHTTFKDDYQRIGDVISENMNMLPVSEALSVVLQDFFYFK